MYRHLHVGLHDAWLNTVKAMGYQMESHILKASNHGVPQIRNRLFYVGRLGEKPNLQFDDPIIFRFSRCNGRNRRRLGEC